MAILPSSIARKFPVELTRIFHFKHHQRSDAPTVSGSMSGVSNSSSNAHGVRKGGGLSGLATTVANRVFHGGRGGLLGERELHLPGIKARHDALVRRGLAEPVTVQGRAGRLEGYFHRVISNNGPNSGGKVVLFLHGTHNRCENQSLPTVEACREQGYDVLAVNMRGYGRSEGTPTEAGHYDDGDAMVRYLVEERGFDPADIIVHGYDMGAPVGAIVANRAESRGEPLGGLVIDRPMWSSDETRGLWGVPEFGKAVRNAVRKQVGDYALASNLEGLQTPIALIHAEKRHHTTVGALIDGLGNLRFRDTDADFNRRHKERYAGTMHRFTREALNEIERASARAGDRDDFSVRSSPSVRSGASDLTHVTPLASRQSFRSLGGEDFFDGADAWLETQSAPEYASPRQRTDADATERAKPTVRRTATYTVDAPRIRINGADVGPMRFDGIGDRFRDGAPFPPTPAATDSSAEEAQARFVSTAQVQLQRGTVRSMPADARVDVEPASRLVDASDLYVTRAHVRVDFETTV